MTARQGLPPPRPRAISRPDAEVPESVFHALQAVHAGQEDTNKRVSDLALAVEQLSAAVRDKWVGLAKVMVPAVVTIVGTIIAARPTVPPPEVRAVKSLVEIRLEHECDPLPAGSQARFDCSQRVFSELEQHGAR